MKLQRALQEWPTCSGIASLLIILHILLVVSEWDARYLSLRPRKVVEHYQFHRIVTNGFFHSSLTHLGLNVLGIYGVGCDLERSLGPKSLLVLLATSVVLTSLLYIGLAYFTCHSVFHNDDVGETWVRLGCKGFSGVLFHWTVLSCHTSGRGAVRSLDFLEGVEIPVQYFPWASLVVWHLADPGNDRGTLMHLCGILAGYLHAWGYLRSIVPDVMKEDPEDESQPPRQSVAPTREPIIQRQLDNAALRSARLTRFHSLEY
jgi:membrane associated rhomboid family serine protease